MFKTFCEGYKLYRKYLKQIEAIHLIRQHSSLNLRGTSIGSIVDWHFFKKDHKNIARILEWTVW